MIPHDQLSRWNRAGLSSIEYVDGNAATFLERLRYLLAQDFSHWQQIQVLDIDTETDAKAQQRMLEQYHGERRDWAWEMLRTFSRATHVLTAHINAYANEGYLGTATQWDNLRKLVEMLDYHPAPPASASTYLVMQTKAGASGMVDAGFQIKYSPPDGGGNVVFETLEDVEVDERLNSLYVDGYGCSQQSLNGSHQLEVDAVLDDLASGQPVLIEDQISRALFGGVIASVEVKSSSTVIKLFDAIAPSPTILAGNAWIYLFPRESVALQDPARFIPKLDYGSLSFPLLDAGHGLQAEDLVCISSSEGEQYRLVDEADRATVELKEKAILLSLEGVRLARAQAIQVKKTVSVEVGLYGVWLAGNWERLQGSNIALSLDSDQVAYVAEAHYRSVNDNAEVKDMMGYTLLNLSEPRYANAELAHRAAHALAAVNIEEVKNVYVPPVNPGSAVDGYFSDAGSHLPTTFKSDMVKKISAPGFICMVSGEGITWARLKAAAVINADSMTDIAVDSWQGDTTSHLFYMQSSRLQGAFKHQVRLLDWSVNDRPVLTHNKQLDLSSANLPDFFRTGRKVLFETAGGDDFIATIDKRDGKTITLDRDISSSDGLKNSTTVIRANIALMGHGERKPARVLGSGNGTEVNQSFILNVADVSFVSDPGMDSGVRADIDVAVDGRIWQQVSSLRNSGPADHHYTVHMTEDSYIRVGFGDGFHGRRLPTGRDNVRISYRLGSGTRGNLDAHLLEKPLRPHRLIDKTFQPIASNGGNDMEAPDSLRNTAPASLLSLERAVSLTDFAILARRHSSVWDARAFAGANGTHHLRNVEVVLVPAGGGSMSDAMRNEISTFLQDHAIPNIRLRLLDFISANLVLDINLRIDLLAFDPDLVSAAVHSALVDEFKLSRRHIGEAIYQSDIYRVVESTTGVSSSICKFDEEMFISAPPGLDPVRGLDGSVRVVRPSDSQVLYLDEQHPALNIRYEDVER